MILNRRRIEVCCGSLQLLSAAVLLLATVAQAQETAPIPQTLEDALHQMSDEAGVVFVGEVVAIRHRAGENGASGVVEIDFRVDQAIRGCTTGGVYTLREWAGLWSGGDQRYRIGQRRLMLLHAPGAAGISSPVGGMDGAIPIRGAATELAPQNVTANATLTAASVIAAANNIASPPSAPPVADLRWVGTRVQRTVSYRPTAVGTRPASAKIAAAGSTPSLDSVSDASMASQQAPISVVVDMLTGWQAKHAAQ